MAIIRSFEELEIWQAASGQCQQIFDLIEDGRFDFDTSLADQINRSSGAVTDRIAEGFDRFSKADFRQALVVARGTNAEVRSQLHRARSRKHIEGAEAEGFMQASEQLGQKIGSLIHHLSSAAESSARGYEGVDEPQVGYGHPAAPHYDLLPQFIINAQYADDSHSG